VAFSKLSPKTICLQAKLNYYNRTQNLLTRWGTAEYSSWFDLLLPGMQSLRAAMPLGGTSNHFITARLRELGGWEAYNVTEDADLGVRLFIAGYQTAMIDSTTYEEANSRYGNWLRQHSRWIKGYMQTYLAYMRHPLRLYRQMGFRAYLVFQLFFGASTLCLLFNPIYWTLAAIWWGFHSPGIQSIFPLPILYAGTVCLFLGNIAFLLTAMSGCLVRRNYSDLKWILLSPFYWLLMSMAAWKALWQLLLRPHYWEKTTHGHHLASGLAGVVDDPHQLVSPPPPSRPPS
jgi:cellulose synthase/poly-beta-1,6-N-acetylglucosamine synthase-like glycosyltransferase